MQTFPAPPVHAFNITLPGPVLIAFGTSDIGQQAIQLHGAIGLTEEHAVGRCVKRVTADERLFGDAEHPLRHIALSEQPAA